MTRMGTRGARKISCCRVHVWNLQAQVRRGVLLRSRAVQLCPASTGLFLARIGCGEMVAGILKKLETAVAVGGPSRHPSNSSSCYQRNCKLKHVLLNLPLCFLTLG